jgi:hypothetical protein
MPDYTVSGSLPDDPNSNQPPKRTRAGQVPLKDLIREQVENFVGEDRKQAEQLIKEVLNDLYQEKLVEYEETKSSFQEVLGNFGIKGRSIGTFKTNMKKILEKSDTDKVKKFDEMTEFARKYAAQILPEGSDDAEGLANALISNYPQRPKKRDLVGDAFNRAIDMGAFGEDYFDYSVFNQENPSQEEIADLLAYNTDRRRHAEIRDKILNTSFDDDYDKAEERGVMSDDPDSYEPINIDNENTVSDQSDEAAARTPPPSSQETSERLPLDDLVQNEFFSPEEMQEMLRGARSGGKKSDDSDRIDNLRFSAVESIASQLMSRAFGTSFYPVLTALRTAREVTKLETDEDVGIGDVIRFTTDSTGKLLTRGADALGLGSIGESISKMLGFSDESSLEHTGAMPLADLPSDDLSRAAQDLSGAASSLDASSDVLDSLAENGGFGGGGGDNIDPSGFNTPDDDDPENEDEMSPAEIIAGLAGLGAIGIIAGTVGKHVFSTLSDTVSDQVRYTSQLAYNSMASPGSVSGVQMAGQPFKAAAGVANAFSPIAGGVAGAAIGKALGPGIGKVAGGIAGKTAAGGVGRAVGGAIGSFIPIPFVGTLIGIAAGGVIGDMISSTVGASIDILKSIDEGIQELSVTLTPFSSDLVGATVEADIARLEAQMRQADQLGGLLAENVRSRSEFELAVTDLGTQIAYAMTPMMTQLYDLLTPLVSIASTNVRQGVDILNAINQISGVFGISIGNTLDDVTKLLNLIAGNTKDDVAFMQELDDFLNPQTNPLDPKMLTNVGAFGGFTL